MIATSSHRITSESELANLAHASRAVVYVTVDWSVPERESRERFHTLVEAVSREHPLAGIQFFVVAEDEPFVRTWLQRVSYLYSSPSFGGFGYGSVIWLEHDQLRHYVLYPLMRGHEVDLYAETLRIFGISAQPITGANAG